MRKLLVFASILLIVGCGFEPVPEDHYLVTNVVDGDTIEVLIDGEEEKIRLIGADTPETVHPNKPVECYGREASDFAMATLLNEYVYLEDDHTQSDKDRYDRLLRYVYIDGENFNERLILEGYAFEYTYGSTPYIYQADFIEAQEYAEENELGLWAPDACM